MKIEKQLVPQIISTFIDEQLVSQAGGLQKFATIASGIVLQKKSTKIMSHPQIQSIGNVLDIIDNDGYIDMDFVIDEVCIPTIERMNNALEVTGIILDKSDFVTMRNIAERLQGAKDVQI